LYPGSGSYHGSELTLSFGTTLNLTGVEDTAQEAEFGEYLQKVWATFARGPASGLRSRLALPKYALGGSYLIRLAYNDSVLPSVVDPALYDVACAGLDGGVT
jgi:cholinesterase